MKSECNSIIDDGGSFFSTQQVINITSNLKQRSKVKFLARPETNFIYQNSHDSFETASLRKSTSRSRFSNLDSKRMMKSSLNLCNQGFLNQQGLLNRNKSVERIRLVPLKKKPMLSGSYASMMANTKMNQSLYNFKVPKKKAPPDVNEQRERDQRLQ